MKKNLLIVSSLSIVAFTFVGMSIPTHAENTTSSTSISSLIKKINTSKTTIKTNKTTIKTNRKAFEEKFENISKYIRQDLTSEERTTVKSIIETKRAAIISLNKTTKAQVESGVQVSTGEFVSKVTTIYNDFKSEMLPYIDDTKLNGFNTFITEKISVITNNRGLRAENSTIKTSIKQEKEERATEKAAEKTTKKTENERKYIQDLIKKIEEVSKKTQTQSYKDALTAAKNILSNQIGTGSTNK